jgi:hypothetical protein
MTVSEPKRKTPPRDWNGDPRELIALLRFMSGQEQRVWIDKLSKSGVLNASKTRPDPSTCEHEIIGRDEYCSKCGEQLYQGDRPILWPIPEQKRLQASEEKRSQLRRKLESEL